MPEGIDPFLKTIPREPYLLCFQDWVEYDPIGIAYSKMIVKDDLNEVTAWR